MYPIETVIMRTICRIAILTLSAGCTLVPSLDWRSPGVSHRLAGRIWDVSAAQFLGADELTERLARCQFVLLGEKHDNAEHHLLQARIIDALVAAGRRPAIAFEMLRVDLQPTVDRVLAGSSPTAAALRAAVKWDESGWPGWNLYAPIIKAALRPRLAITAADLPRSWIDIIHRQGLEGLSPAVRARLTLDEPLPTGQRLAMADGIREAYCGYAPASLVDRMIDLQRARDAHLARTLLDRALTSNADGAVLIAGTEHARIDRAVPVHLARWTPRATVASVAFLEVDPEYDDPPGHLAAHLGATPPFHYVWFTSRVDDLDPCERFKEKLQKLGESSDH